MIYLSTTHNGGTQLTDRVKEDTLFTDTIVGRTEGSKKQVFKMS